MTWRLWLPRRTGLAARQHVIDITARKNATLATQITELRALAADLRRQRDRLAVEIETMRAATSPAVSVELGAAVLEAEAAWTAQLRAERARDEMRDALEGARNEIARLRSALAAHEGRTT